MPNPIKKSVKEERSHKLIALSRELEKNFRQKFLGDTVEVLFEEEVDNNTYEGLTGNYMKVVASSGENLHNKLALVTLKENTPDHLVGEIRT
jgi:threonylcarbamoyladenosine tRNA methylthiotransferase MtaB